MKNLFAIVAFCLLTAGEAWLLQSFGVNDSLHSAITTGVQQANLAADLAVAFMLLCLPRRATAVICVAQCILGSVLASNLHFLRIPLSLAAILSGWEDFSGMGATAMLEYVHLPSVAACLCVLLMQLLLLRRLHLPLPGKARLAICLCICVALGCLLHSRLYSAQRVSQRMNGTEIVMYFGYVPGWIVELATGRTNELQSALAMPACPRLPENMPMLPFTRKLAVIQVESLDFGLLTQPRPYPMPFLQQLMRHAAVFRVDGMKKLGSANSDYEWLTGCQASPSALMYGALPSIPKTFNQLLQDEGYSSRFFHGLTGLFMRLRPTYEKLGFSHLYFKEEYEAAGYHGNAKTFMQQIHDADLLDYAARFLNDPAPFFHFIVTISMHSARDFPPPAELKHSPHAGYFGGVRLFDNALRDYVAKMPDDVTLLIIGDHTSYYEPRLPDMPAIVYRKDMNLARLMPAGLPRITRCQWGLWLRENFHFPMPDNYLEEHGR